MDGTNRTTANVTSGVDTHKDLHVAAVADERDCVLGTRSFPTTRQGYRQMLAWMRTFGQLQRIGIESSGSYCAGLLRYSRLPISISWKSRPQIDTTGAGVARTTIWTLRTPRMQPSRASAL